MGELNGKIALVTGASRGIGAAIAKRFAMEGARVAVTARTLDQHDHLPGSLRDTVSWIEQRGGRAVPIVGDLADSKDYDRIVAEAQASLGPIEILVNNAAAAFYLPFDKLSENRFRVAYAINVHAPWRLSQLVLPAMRARGEGWILNISSATSVHPARPYRDFDGLSFLYGSTKAALERFTAGLAAAEARHGIRVNSMAPVGAVPTEGTDALGVVPEEALAVAESREAMAEAALALCVTRDEALSGRITYCTPILEELHRPVRALDGKTRLEGPFERQAIAFRD
jgi:citronellol/citronellal dehydrogenase